MKVIVILTRIDAWNGSLLEFGTNVSSTFYLDIILRIPII